MPEILKVTSPIIVKERINSIPGKLPTDSIFDIGSSAEEIKVIPKDIQEKNNASGKELLLNLGQEILKPINDSTMVEIDNLRALILSSKLFAALPFNIDEEFLQHFFLNPKEMLEALIKQDKGATPFSGEAFDILKLLAKVQGNPQLSENIAAILRHFDALINQGNSLKAVVIQSKDLINLLFSGDKSVLQQHVDKLQALIQTDFKGLPNQGNATNETNVTNGQVNTNGNAMIEGLEAEHKQVRQFLKNEFIPLLSEMVNKYELNDKIRNPVMAIIHHIVRFDKGEPKLLNQSLMNLAETLKPITSLKDEDFLEMRRMIFDAAKELKSVETKRDLENMFLSKYGIEADDKDMASLLSKVLEESSPVKMQNMGQNMLGALIRSESPVMQLMHYILPIKFGQEDTYVEMYIDKEPTERKGQAENSNNIFFMIKSDEYGTFQVDLLQKDKMIDLDIKCPKEILDDVKKIKNALRIDVEKSGYRLANYQVGEFSEETSIVKKFPKLGKKKVGMDVKI